MDFDLIDDGTATDRTTFTNLSPGTFAVTETVPAGWQLTNLSCTSLGTGTSTTPDPANQTVSITVGPGGSVICTFTDSQESSITIIKEALPEGMTTFPFTTTGTGLSDFDLIDDGTATDRTTFSNLLPGLFEITETVPSGWQLTGLNCVSTGTGTMAAEDPAMPGDDYSRCRRKCHLYFYRHPRSFDYDYQRSLAGRHDCVPVYHYRHGPDGLFAPRHRAGVKQPDLQQSSAPAPL